MFERIYAWFLHLYPARFREAYGAEALQLVRDRMRHEKGFFRKLRLAVPRAELDGTAYGKEIARRDRSILGHPGNILFAATEPECLTAGRAAR